MSLYDMEGGASADSRTWSRSTKVFRILSPKELIRQLLRTHGQYLLCVQSVPCTTSCQFVIQRAERSFGHKQFKQTLSVVSYVATLSYTGVMTWSVQNTRRKHCQMGL